MTITIEPPSGSEEAIARAASEAGMTLEHYALHVLTQQAISDIAAKQKTDAYHEWDQRLIAFATRHDPLPQPIPLEALRRENIYEE